MDCDGGYLWLIAAVAISAATIIVSLLIVRNNTRRIKCILMAIRNNDYSMKYGSHGIVTETLNEITDILAEYKTNMIKQEKYYEYILNNLSIGIIVVDENDCVVKCNNEVLKMFDLQMLSHLSKLKSFDGLDDILCNIRQNEKKHISLHVGDKNLDISIRISHIIIQEKDYRVFTLNDIHAEIDRNEFDSWVKLTRVLTHEIMNGIAPISSLSENMLNSKDVPPHFNEGLKVINATSHSMLNFVESYRKFTSIPVPAPALIYVKELVNKAYGILSDKNDINIEVMIDPLDLIVYADEALVMQVMINIIKNAVEALNGISSKKIQIYAYCDSNESVRIEISNNGPEINNNDLPQIFVPFFTTKTEGSGVGLSVSRQIMMLSGGNLLLQRNLYKSFSTTFVLLFN